MGRALDQGLCSWASPKRWMAAGCPGGQGNTPFLEGSPPPHPMGPCISKPTTLVD